MAPSMSMDVWGSTLHDHTHKGPNQAGNKSMLTYRSDLGVPGYTGYIPAPSAVQVPTKVFEHTGRPVDPPTSAAAVRSTVNTKNRASEYATSYQLVPGQTQTPDKTGGGYWIPRPLGITAPPMTARTSYQAEVCNGGPTAEAQLTKSIGLRCTLPQYEAARQTAPRAHTADAALRPTLTTLSPSSPLRDPSGPRGPPGGAWSTRRSVSAATQRPFTAVTSHGEVVGYQTTQAALYVEQPQVGGPAAPGLPRSRRAVNPYGETRYQSMPHAMPPSFHGASSSYHTEFGQDTSDPMQRGAPNERFQTRCATTRDLAGGTTRVTNNLPGYAGHIAASQYNQLGQAQSAGADERVDLKTDMMLYALDQFPRGRVPHWTGFKPQAARNITLDQPSQGPPKETTQGAANLQATKGGLPVQDHAHHNNSQKGIMTFFSATGTHVSDNGLANAQCYYGLCRPGNSFHHSHLPHATDYGKPFNPRNSMV